MLGPVISSVLYVFNTLIDLYEFVIIVAVIASWLIVFGVLSTSRTSSSARWCMRSMR